MNKPNFASDYVYAAHPSVLRLLQEVNTIAFTGYGTDDLCESARARIRKAADCPTAAIHFLSGGTQANLTVISAFLQSHEAVFAAETGHINGHEAGAIELTGHKVLLLPGDAGKLSAKAVRFFMEQWSKDENRAHTVRPAMVYVSQPTEYGTLYTKRELQDLKAVCRDYGMALYLDGARLAYALATPDNDVTLPDLSALCDVFYIGGTKCGALFGEAVVIPDPTGLPYFFTQIKQRGALLAKGFVLGAQFEALFRDDLYSEIGKPAIRAADKIRLALREKGYPLHLCTPTNQIFVRFTNEQYKEISSRAALGFWEQPDEAHTVARIATSWATTDQDVEELLRLL